MFMRSASLLVTASLLAVGLAGCATPGLDDDLQAGTIPFASLEQGSESGIEERREVVVRDAQAWQQLWDEHTEMQLDPPEAPSVDFDERMVVAVFKGQSANGCHGAEISQVSGNETQQAMVVHGAYFEQVDTFCTEAITHPYHMATVPHWGGEVIFDMIQEQRGNASDDGDGADDDPDNGAGEVPFETIEQGQSSGIQERSEHVVRSQDAWEALWANHSADDGNEDEPPEVDFSQRMVVAVFKGQSSNACHGAEVTNVTASEGGDELVVAGEYYEITDAYCAEVLTYPFHIVAVDQTDGEVTFEMQETERSSE